MFMSGSQRAATDQLVKLSNPLFYNNTMLGQCRSFGDVYIEKFAVSNPIERTLDLKSGDLFETRLCHSQAA